MPATNLNPYDSSDPRHWEWELKASGLGEDAGSSPHVKLVDSEDAMVLGASAAERADYLANGEEAARRYDIY